MRRAAVILLLFASGAAGSPPVANPAGPIEAGPVEADRSERGSAEPQASGAAERRERPALPQVEDTAARAGSDAGEGPATASLPLGRRAEDRGEASAAGEDAAPGGGVMRSPAAKTAGALTLVLSLIFGMRSLFRAAARRGSGGLAGALGAGGRAPSGVLSVLGRYPVGRGATLVLLQLDRRVLLLSQTSAGFQPLCELTDPEDVASVVRKTADEEGASMSKRFAQLLKASERDPSIGGERVFGSGGPVTPRRAMGLREFESSLDRGEAGIEAALEASPGAGDSYSSIRRRLEKLREGAA